jgi:hypothetical protein
MQLKKYSSDEITKMKIGEKYENILKELLNYNEKENTVSDLSFKWYILDLIKK